MFTGIQFNAWYAYAVKGHEINAVVAFAIVAVAVAVVDAFVAFILNVTLLRTESAGLAPFNKTAKTEKERGRSLRSKYWLAVETDRHLLVYPVLSTRIC